MGWESGWAELLSVKEMWEQYPRIFSTCSLPSWVNRKYVIALVFPCCIPCKRVSEHNFTCVTLTKLACWFVVSLCEAVFHIAFVWLSGMISTDWPIGLSIGQTRSKQNRCWCATQKLRSTSPIWLFDNTIWLCRLLFVVVCQYRGFVQIGLRKHHAVSCWQ